MEAVKLSCSSSAYGKAPLPEVVERIAAIGYSGIEIRAGHERSGPGDIEPQALRSALVKHDIEVANIAVGSMASGTSGERTAPGVAEALWLKRTYIERIKHYIKLAHALGCSSVGVCPGRALAMEDEEQVRAYQAAMLEGLNEVSKFGRGLGVAVGVTYGPGLFLSTAAEVEPFLIKCRGLKLAIHVGNSHLACETPCNITKDFRHRIKHVQIADVGPSNRPYLIPGAGEIEWISYFKTLRWIGYEGFVTVDLSSYRDMPDAAARRAYLYLANIRNSLSRPREKRSA